MNLRQLRTLFAATALFLTLGLANFSYAASVVAVRLWPAEDYTRITIESDGALQYTQKLYQNPPRLGVDISGLTLTPELRGLVDKLQPDDPNVAGIRIGQFAPDVVRLVIDLKQPIAPQVFNLPPIATYQNRLVFDLYPLAAPDPLAQLIRQRDREIKQPTNTSASTNALDDWLSRMAVPSPSAPNIFAPNPVASASDADPLGELIASREPVINRPARSSTNNTVSNTASTDNTRASRRNTSRLILVAIDPGHGGEDPGAIGPNGTREKDVVLRIAKILRDRINASSVGNSPMRAFLTRDGDYFVPLQTRVQKARRVQADLFISIHADAFVTAQASGSSVFALSQNGASSTAANWLANKENQADLIGGININHRDAAVRHAILDLSTSAQIRDSLALGGSLLGKIGKINRLHKSRVEQAGFAVLKAPDMPSVLVETAFISNPKEEAQLRDAAYQASMAESLLRGIQDYFSNNPPLARSNAL